MPRGPDPEIEQVDILHHFVVSPEPAFVPQEIADSLDVTKEGVRHQMEKLVDKGLLARKKPSSRIVIYWITDKGRRYYAENADSS
ncbi:MarR family winged helix-turn-helix transcriptional regulator [Halomicroarcula sp. F27]|uniref:MarR family winged helix-turn-helix transcriptional regulator n=1 Tax=Haloarcula nitratireducens TaxID=2487749 RepID=A0AAW4PJ76_9EURY|nr:MarR family winged helix-turn-helix transcriptional regulator [Halomicroarcula nitratireducens]